MKDHEQLLGEDELRRMRPAATPPELTQRLLAARPSRQPALQPPTRRAPEWRAVLRWLVPVTASAAAVVLAVLVWRSLGPSSSFESSRSTADAGPAVKADDVEIGQQLVSSFDTVARLPSGEPVRFRCREWMDEVILRDKEEGLTIEQRTPRVEVIPVRFETY